MPEPGPARAVVRRGLAEADRAPAAAIYVEAFERKLVPLLGDSPAARRLVGACMHLDRTYGAWLDGRLVGIAGHHDDQGPPMEVPWGRARQALGFVRGTVAWLTYLEADGSRLPPDQVRVSALAVAAGARGAGVGTALLDAVAADARAAGRRTVRLEVVIPNTAARRLYERLGYRVVDTRRFPLPERWLGFNGDHIMELDLTAGRPPDGPDR